MRTKLGRQHAGPRGSPGVRLISSFAMLAVAVGGVWFYSVRKTNELFDMAVNAHINCAIDGNYPRQTQKTEMLEGLGVRFAPMLQPVLDSAGLNYAAVAAHRCDVAGRAWVHILLRKGSTLISVLLTMRGSEEGFPRAGRSLHQGSRDGYSVAAFESGAWLVSVISALPGRQNADLARNLVGRIP
jgi:hypothetical protein